MQFIKSLVFCFLSVLPGAVSKADDLPADFYTRKVQPLFDNRCIACHSCFNAPCQLNLQSFEGFQRGASSLNVYDGTRVKSTHPTRLWVDASTEKEWRKNGFFEVNTSIKSDENLFMQFINLRKANPHTEVKKQVADTQMCISTSTEFKVLSKLAPELGMPYGLPPLNPNEMEVLNQWIAKGAPGGNQEEAASPDYLSKDILKQIREWETYLNERTPEQRLVSRYLYEHLFLAHIYFPESDKDFFRLVRSSTDCHKGVREISTRRPNDDPGTKQFFYCLRKFPGTVVLKTHITYAWSPAKLARYRHLFSGKDWKVTQFPSYEAGVAENPFIAFKDIPAKARYQFLLDDAQYHVNTFIKGPVCNGSMAVNAIQQQFFVFFLRPDADNIVKFKDYETQAQKLLMMPGVWGSDVEITDTPVLMKKMVDHREAYRKLRSDWQKKAKSEGYVLQDIWDGDGYNSNAVLTVFRHDDNAVVMKGAVGDLSKTIFVLDYPLFERLVYNLVVNFDVFGNVGHQYLTRLYMDLIRMEAEELFLSFLPPEQRLKNRQQWYRGFLTQAMLTYVFPTIGVAEPTGVRFRDDVSTKKQMVEKILFFLMSAEVRGSLDGLNWKELSVPRSLKKQIQLSKIEQELRKISSVKAEKKTPFPRFFPEVSLLKIGDASGKRTVYSVIHNKEHENISWVLAESLRLAPEEDSLTIREGYWGSYPNMIFDMTEAALPDFVQHVKKIKSQDDYQKLVSKFGVRRSNPHFWRHYDELNAHFRQTYPIDFGYLDLTRYELK